MSDEALLSKLEQLLGSKTAKAIKSTTNINLIPSGLILSTLWGMGLVVSQGFWWTLMCVFPPIGAGTSLYWLITKFAGA